jgi:hypothetical protein
MARIYSYNFDTEGGFVGGGVHVIVPPSGFRYVVRDIDGVGRNTDQSPCELDFAILGVRFAVFSCPALAAIHIRWRGRVVLPGDPGPYSIVVSAPGPIGASWEWTVNGYQLTYP